MPAPRSTAAGENGIRSRMRTQVRTEVKAAGLRMLASGGPQAISVNAIARELGVSGPALYRYFTNRDELLAELVEDSYHDFYATLAVAFDDQSERPTPGRRLRMVAEAYRNWALAEPHRYRLLFQAPVPGFNAQEDRFVHAAQPAMNLLIDALLGCGSESPSGAQPDPPPPLASQLDRWLTRHGRQVPVSVAQRAVSTWARLHGLVSLEIEGNLEAMGLDPDLFFATEVDRLVEHSQ
jgi:AcrR family transcriptional regulator